MSRLPEAIPVSEILARLAQGDQEIASGEGYDLDSILTEANVLERLAREGSREAFERVLAKVPDVEPDPWDRW